MITITKEAYIEGVNPSISLSDVPEGNYEIVIVLQPLNLLRRNHASMLPNSIRKHPTGNHGSFSFAKRWLVCRAKPNVPFVR